jgi:cation diffusion facilitator family transporter
MRPVWSGLDPTESRDYANIMDIPLPPGLPVDGDCTLRTPQPRHGRERGLQAVVLLTFAMMVIEIVAGYATGSMALLADGWHMATHVGALGMASAAYWLSRRFASHRAFAFGTGKVHSLAGYSSALLLGVVAVVMVVESVQRLLQPGVIDFSASLPVAVAGLVVNLVSVGLLRGHDTHEHHQHDHNHRAALAHVVADTLTSALAIVALCAGRFWGLVWLDPASGVLGGLLILKWTFELCTGAAFELLNVEPDAKLENAIRRALEQPGDVRVGDLHVWSLGHGVQSCVATVFAAEPAPVSVYHQRLSDFQLAHLTIEVRRLERPAVLA